MIIIPGINCQDFEKVKTRLAQTEEIFFGAGGENRDLGVMEGWVHIDVADGGFTNGYATWRNPEDLKTIKLNPNLKIEVHLMITSPEAMIPAWIAAGAKRIIVHLEAVENVEIIVTMCSEAQVELMLAIAPSTPAEHLSPYLAMVSSCQLLAVHPGLAGQKFQEEILQKIKTLKAQFPDLRIEVDCGVTPAVAQLCKQAGATQVVATSYIFSSDNYVKAYNELTEAVNEV